MQLNGKVTLITGGGSGIGEATARLMAQEAALKFGLMAQSRWLRLERVPFVGSGKIGIFLERKAF